MQQKVVEPKDHKLRIIGIILMVLLVAASIVLAFVLHNSWHAYTNERDRISGQLSELQNKHASLIMKQEELEKQRANLESALQRPLLEKNLDPQLALKLQRLYNAIDALPTTRKHAAKNQVSNNNASKPANQTAENFADRLVDGLKSIVTVTKKDSAYISRVPLNSELAKVQLKLAVNEMRWSWLEHDKMAYQHCIEKAQDILERNFDPNDRQVQKVATMLDELETNR